MKRRRLIAIATYSLILVVTIHLLLQSVNGWMVALMIVVSQLGIAIGYLLGALGAVPKTKFLVELRHLVESASRSIISSIDRNLRQGDRIENGIQTILGRLQDEDDIMRSDRMQRLINELRDRDALVPERAELESLLMLMCDAQFTIARTATSDGKCPCCGHQSSDLADEELFHLPKNHKEGCIMLSAMELVGYVESAVSETQTV